MSKRITPEIETFARIRVIGIGGSGVNAINHMVNSKVKGVEFIAINSDAQDLHGSLAKRKIHIGKNLTHGLGTGMNSDLGRRAAEETRQEIQESLQGSDMVFVTCGMGGGTGTGAAPIIAKIAKELGALTIAVVTKPFSFEGAQRARLADEGLLDLKKEVDAFIVIPNDKILSIVDQQTSAKSAFAMCDEVLRQAVEGVSDIITTPGDINTDFNDIRSIMENAGPALMGIGIAENDGRATEAATRAVNSPLLNVSINGAKGILFVVAGSDDLGILEIQEAAKVINESTDKDARIIFGMMHDEKMKKGQIRIIVIATGFPEGALETDNTTNTGRSLFSLPLEKQQEERGKIYNDVLKHNKGKEDPTDKIKKDGKIEPVVNIIPKKTEKGANIPEPKTKQSSVANTDEEEVWGAIPQFLRRHKK